MKNLKHLLLVIALIRFLSTSAQTSNSLNELDSTFSMLRKDRITTGFLIDNVPLSIIPMDSGVIFDTVSSLNAWDQMYFQMKHADLNSFLPRLDTLVQRRNEVYNDHNAIPLLSMYLQYNGISSTALDNGALVWNADSTILLDGDSTQNPYFQSEFFMSYPTSSYFDQNVRLWVSRDFLFSNVPENAYLNLYIDAHNGQGPQLVPWESVYSVNVPAGERVLTVSLRNGDYPLFTHEMLIHVEIYDPNKHAQIHNLWNYSAEITASIPYEGVFSKAKYDVKYGKDRNGVDHTCIHKPFILVEGIDFGYKNHRIGYYGDGRPTYKYGTLGFMDVLGEGAEYNMEKGPMGSWVPDKLPIFNEGKNFVTQLNEMGYDVIYLDFYDGADKIERSAMALVELFNQINTIKCEHEEIVVMGASMGGQTARYALAYMEKNNMPHCTRLYASFDSPHQGANIPLAVQGTLLILAPNIEAASELKKQMLDRSGANELLLMKAENMLSSSSSSQFPFPKIQTLGSEKSHPLRDEYLNRLKEVGNYPNSTRNVAIACGNGSGIPFDKLSNGNTLFDAKIEGKIRWAQLKLLEPAFLKLTGKKIDLNINTPVTAEISISANAGKGHFELLENLPSPLPNVLFSYKKKITNFKFTISEEYLNSLIDLPNFDEVPGGGRNDITLFKDEIAKLKGTSVIDPKTGIGVSISSTNFNDFGIPMFSFIPTVSALDFNTNDLKENVYNSLQGKKDKPQPQFHPFESVYFQPENTPIKDKLNNKVFNLPHVFISRFGKYGSDNGIIKMPGSIDDLNMQGNADWGMHEVLINEDLIKGRLPNINYYSNQAVSYINLGNLSRDVISSCTIGSGGVLHINGDNPISRIKYNLKTSVFEQDPDAGLIPAKGSTFEVSTCNCENPVITIATDGLIKVGDDNGLDNTNNKGILRIRKGATLQILGTLKVFNGSKVIIEPGATLEYYPGAKIILQGELSEFLIQGKVVIRNGAEFSIHPGLSSVGGHVVLESNTINQGEVFTAIGGGHIKLSPPSGSPVQELLVVRGGMVSIASSISSFSMDRAIVLSESYSGLKLFNQNVQITHTQVEGNGTFPNGIVLLGQSNVQIIETSFKNLSMGLMVNNNYFNQTTPTLTKLRFTNCETGILYSGRGIQLREFLFNSCGTGIQASGINTDSKIEKCVFSMGNQGIVMENTAVNMVFTSNTFNHLQDAGITTSSGGNVLECNGFNSCAIGLMLNPGTASLSPSKSFNGISGGNNTFTNCEIAIQSLGVELYLDNGANNFINTRSQTPYNFIVGKVDYSNLGTSNSLQASGNYFNPSPTGNNLANATSDWYSLQTVLPVNPHPANVSLTGSTRSNPSTSCSTNTNDNSSQLENQSGLPVLDNITLQPNPVTTQLNVNVNVLIPNNPVTLKVLSSSGMVLLTQTSSSGGTSGSTTFPLDVSSLASGMYYLQIITATQVIYFAFVKN